MGTEFVSVAAGGGNYGGFERVEVTAAINEAARSFSLETTEHPGEFSFPPGTPIQILATGDLMVDGYVNGYNADGDADTHQISITGRGKGQDFVDCAAVHPKGYAKDKTPGQFAQELDKFGVGVTEKVPGDPVPMQQIYQGETCLKCVERYLRPAGKTMMGRADGGIDITNAKAATRAAGALVEGVNIMKWSVQLGDAERRSEYTVKAQNRTGTRPDELRIKETANDSGVKRYRPRIIVLETDGDKARARERADHEKERCAGNSVKATITVQGWRDAGGKLWEPNSIVFVNSPILMHIVQDMLIEKVTFSQDNGDSGQGTTAKLDLVDPRAYRGKGQDGKGTAPAVNDGW